MISVIMPTMWLGSYYDSMLPAFNEHPLVGEIIIIDNDTEVTDPRILALSKVKHYPQKENIYVNPAWNLGAKLATYDKLCLYSDDVKINTNILNTIYDSINPNNGMLGLKKECLYETMHFMDEAKNAKLYEINDLGDNPGYAACFFIHKESYYEIPEDLKIYWGDVYLFFKNKIAGKQNYGIGNMIALTLMSTTSSMPEFNPTLFKDTQIFEEKYAAELLVQMQQNAEDGTWKIT
jgi:hypothetical protein